MSSIRRVRSTFTLADDVAAEVEDLRRREGIGISEAVNRLIRNGLVQPERRVSYVNRPADLGLTIDVTNIGDVLDLLDDDRA